MKQSTSAGLIIALAEKAKQDLKEFAIPGPRGKQGARGEQGFLGPEGLIGPDGLKGEIGDRGMIGEEGSHGERGLIGPRGAHGDDGNIGEQGFIGPKGNQGDQGEMGQLGLRGPAGPIGEMGDPGMVGPDGTSGLPGLKGAKGAKGDKGSVGKAGITGTKGAKGAKGELGKIGPAGVVAELPDIVKIVKENLDPQFDQMNQWRANIQKSLASLGGGGSYKILDNADVTPTKPSELNDNDMFVWRSKTQKFVTLNITDVINSIRTELEVQFDKLVFETTDSDAAVASLTFIGESAPGSMADSAVWRLKRVRELVDGNTEILWANDTDSFNKVWDLKETYTYDV